MGNYGGTRDVVIVPINCSFLLCNAQEDRKAVVDYRSKVKDTTTSFFVVSKSKARRLGNKAIRSYLRRHSF